METVTNFFLFISLIVCIFAANDIVRFDNHQLVRLKMTPELVAQFQGEIVLSHDGSLIAGAESDILVSPHKQHLLKNVSHEVLIKNFQYQVDLEQTQIRTVEDKMNKATAKMSSEEKKAFLFQESNWFGNYHKYEEHVAWIMRLKQEYPTMVDYEVIGKSIENRDVMVVKIHAPGAFSPSKKAMILHSSMHAREWATPACGQYFVYQFLSQYASNPKLKDVLDNINIFYVPFINPDGFKFTERNRMWRKNRRGGYGVDLNRNWAHGWGGEGSSNQRSSEIYRGEKALSEPESSAIDAFVKRNPTLKAGIDLHQYGQIILRPYGNTIQPSPDEAKLKAIGDKMQTAIRSVNGLSYRTVRAREFWAAAGIIHDHYYAIYKMIGFTIEMRPPHASFHIPPEQILPNAKENFEALLVIAQEVRNS